MSEQNISHNSTRLFTRTNFLEGIAKNMDSSGFLDVYKINSSPEEADIASLTSDWSQVNDDLVSAWGQRDKLVDLNV